MSIIFEKISAPSEVSDFLYLRIEEILQKKKVLWLIPGGSAISIAVEVAKKLSKTCPDLEKLTVTLTDERFGEVGHKDSNWAQLELAGFSLSHANLHPVLRQLPIDETVQVFEEFLQKEFEKGKYCLGFFGIGTDGHTAGILPFSPASHSQNLVCGYDANSFKRITMTPIAIAKLDEAVVYAVGDAKHIVLDQLEETLSVEKQPAQALKTVTAVHIFNDYK